MSLGNQLQVETKLSLCLPHASIIIIKTLQNLKHYFWIMSEKEANKGHK